ncbi:GAF domain-containing protein [Desulfococcaceae bacterium HSG9]|nr:GAF domain-containing protein [Desulfococcaceae bacterium HSG9]
MDNVLEDIPELIVRKLNYSKCALFLADKSRRKLLNRASYGFESDNMRAIHRYSIKLRQNNFLSDVFKYQHPQVVNHLDEIRQSISEQELSFLRQVNAEKFAVCPIVFKQNGVGLLLADTPVPPRELHQSDINMLMAVVPQIGIVIDQYFEKIDEMHIRIEKRLKGIPVASRYKDMRSTADKITQTPIDSLVTFFNVLKYSFGVDPNISKYLEK